jgi:hypothetical protein
MNISTLEEYEANKRRCRMLKNSPNHPTIGLTLPVIFHDDPSGKITPVEIWRKCYGPGIQGKYRNERGEVAGAWLSTPATEEAIARLDHESCGYEIRLFDGRERGPLFKTQLIAVYPDKVDKLLCEAGGNDPVMAIKNLKKRPEACLRRLGFIYLAVSAFKENRGEKTATGTWFYNTKMEDSYGTLVKAEAERERAK